MACLINIGANYLNDGREATRWGSAHESIVPYEVFQTKDSYISVGAGSDVQFKILTEKLNLNHLLENEKFQSNSQRVKNRDELLSILRKTFLTKTNKEWNKIFENSSFPYGNVNTIKQVNLFIYAYLM